MRVELADRHYEIHGAPATLSHSLRTVPGARHLRSKDYWKVPATPVQWLLLQDLVGPEVKSLPYPLPYTPTLSQQNTLLNHLRPYQRDGVDFIYENGSGILGDEMGLGKTWQLVAAMDTSQRTFPSLVVCGTSLLHTWERTIQRIAVHLHPVVLYGNITQRRKLIEAHSDDPDVVFITTYETMASHIHLSSWGGVRNKPKQNEPKEFTSQSFSWFVMDEAHKIKNPGTVRWRACRSVSARYRWGLTGTVIVNNPDDYWGVASVVNPDWWGSRTQFRESFCDYGPGWFGGVENRGLLPHRRAMWQEITRNEFLVRKKTDVLKDLPEKLPVQFRVLPMKGAQAKAYQQMKEDHLVQLDDGTYDIAVEPMVLANKLRVLAVASPGPAVPSNKLDALKDIIEEAHPQPVVAFFESRKAAEMFRTHLEGSALYTGAMGRKLRDATAADFQAGRIQCLLCTFGAAAEGLDLYAANTVVLVQQSWSNVANMQAIDRVHRIGQDLPVTPIVLLTEGTMDERARERADGKDFQLRSVLALHLKEKT